MACDAWLGQVCVRTPGRAGGGRAAGCRPKGGSAAGRSRCRGWSTLYLYLQRNSGGGDGWACALWIAQ